MAKTSRESFKFMLRLPEDLRDRLKSIADASGRSMTAEIIDRLEDSFDYGFSGQIADEAFFRGIQIGIVESLFMEDDPCAALHELREKLRRPRSPLEIIGAIDD